MFKTIAVILAVCIGVTASILVFQYGAVTPCGIVRSMARNEAAKTGAFGTLLASLPDVAIDGLMGAAVGPLTPARCLSMLLPGPAKMQPPPRPVQVAAPYIPNHPAPPPSPSAPAPAAIPTDWAMRQANAAVAECRSQRLSGELKSYVASVPCSNPRILQAFQVTHYRYMDLIYQLNAERWVLAERLDKGLLTEAQASLENAQFISRLRDQEMRRDRGQ